MGASARVFGFSPLSVLAPQAIMGVASSLLVYMIIRRNYGAVGSLIGMVVFFTTPIIALMSRYNNPDPLMILLTLAAVYLVLKNIDTGRAMFLILAGVLLGLAFMTKQLQGLIVLPFAGAAFLCWSPIRWAAKIWASGAALTATVVAGGLWMLTVDLMPPHSRPYVGGSTTNSVLELTFGYNGLDRLIPTNDEAVATMVPARFRQVDSDAGLARLLNANYGQEIAWLLFASLFAALAIAVFWKRLPSTRGARATAFLAVTWLIGTFLVLSLMGNQIHTYYTAALAPALAIVVGLSVDTFTRHRDSVAIRLTSTLTLVVASLTSWMLLSSTWGWPTWLPTLVLSCGILAAALLITKPPTWGITAFACTIAVAALLAGPVLTAIYSTTVSHNGSNPVSGHLSRGSGSINRFLHELQLSSSGGAYQVAFGRDPDKDVVSRLRQANSCRWSAATYASQTAAKLQLSVEKPIMPLGGFAGVDPTPSLEKFTSLVSSGQVCYFLPQEEYLRDQTRPVEVGRISAWVAQNFEPENVNGHTVFDLTKGRKR